MPIFPLPLSGPRRLNFTVREISGGHDRRRFVRFAARLYRGDRYWAPGIISEQLRSLDPKKNPGLAHIRLGLFAAESRTLDEIIGAIAVWADDRAGTTRPVGRVGFFGMFEVINEEEVAGSLFEAAESWIREHLPGVDRLRGPLELDPCRSPGLLVDGYNQKPAALMPYNPPYYAELIEDAGYEPGTELLAYQLDLSALRDPSGQAMTRLRAGAQSAGAGRDLVVREIGRESDWQTILSAAQPALADTTWRLDPESPAVTFPEMLVYLKRITGQRPSSITLVGRAGENGKVVAFGVAAPNLRESALVALARRLTDGWLGNSGSVSSLSWLCRGACGTEPLRMTPRGDSAPREVRTRQGMVSRSGRKAGIRLMPAIVREDCLAWGLEAPILAELLTRAVQQGYATAEASPVPIDDLTARDSLAALGASPRKRYAICEKRF